jgi:hypothetical protein
LHPFPPISIAHFCNGFCGSIHQRIPHLIFVFEFSSPPPNRSSLPARAKRRGAVEVVRVRT